MELPLLFLQYPSHRVHYKIFSLKEFFFKVKYLLQHFCRTTLGCRHKALLSNSGPDSIKKDSRSAHRADRSRQRQAGLHTVGFSSARAGGPIASLCAEWPKASLLCGTQVYFNKYLMFLKKSLLFRSFLSNFFSQLTFLSCFFFSKFPFLSTFLSKLSFLSVFFLVKSLFKVLF